MFKNLQPIHYVLIIAVVYFLFFRNADVTEGYHGPYGGWGYGGWGHRRWRYGTYPYYYYSQHPYGRYGGHHRKRWRRRWWW